MHSKDQYTLSGIKQAPSGIISRKEPAFCLFFQEAIKRCVVAAKGIEDHFSSKSETNSKRIEAGFAHKLPVSVAEIEEQRLVFALQALGQLFFQLGDVF